MKKNDFEIYIAATFMLFIVAVLGFQSFQKIRNDIGNLNLNFKTMDEITNANP